MQKEGINSEYYEISNRVREEKRNMLREGIKRKF